MQLNTQISRKIGNRRLVKTSLGRRAFSNVLVYDIDEKYVQMSKKTVSGDWGEI